MPFRRIDPSRPSVQPLRVSPPLPEEIIRGLVARKRVPRPSIDAPSTGASRPKASARSGPNWDGTGDYKVGKGRPPLHSRFQPGQSGNPKGRTPGGRGATAQARQILGEKVPVKVRGKTRNLDAFGMLLSVAFDRALKGDLRAIDLVMRRYSEIFPEKAAVIAEVISREDQALIDHLLESAGIGANPVVRQKRQQGDARDGCDAEELDTHERAACGDNIEQDDLGVDGDDGVTS